MYRTPDFTAFDDPDPFEEEDLSGVIIAKEHVLVKR